MLHSAPAAMFDHYLGISRLLAGQLDFRSAIRSVAAEVAHIIPHDHLDVCVLLEDGNYHTAYETALRPPGRPRRRTCRQTVRSAPFYGVKWTSCWPTTQ